jgi:alpha-tubulin suppressor-like RCC1 family protein
MRLSFGACAVSLGLGFAACTDSTQPGGAVASIVIAPGIDTLPTGDTLRLVAAALDSRGDLVLGQPMAWSSSSPGIATVTSSGLVTGKAPGVATIYAAIGETVDSSSLTVFGLFQATAVSAGWIHTCALSEDGAAFCWGSNFAGLLGNGIESGRSLLPTPVSGGHSWVTLTLGLDHSCGISTSGTAFCWGQNSQGQLGDGSQTLSSVPIPVQASGPVSALGAGVYSTCAIVGTATECWGWLTGFANPSLTTVSIGYDHGCGLAAGGIAYCWGDNFNGELGDGTTTFRATPVPVSGGITFSAVEAGLVFSCGLRTDGAAFCWGSNTWGQLGTGSTASDSLPVMVSGGLVFTRLSAGDGHVCGLLSDGTAYCWGQNDHGQLGHGSFTDREPLPIPVAGGLRFREIAAGSYHTCGLTTASGIYCWGANRSGQLGNNGLEDHPIPGPVWAP